VNTELLISKEEYEEIIFEIKLVSKCRKLTFAILRAFSG